MGVRIIERGFNSGEPDRLIDIGNRVRFSLSDRAGDYIEVYILKGELIVTGDARLEIEPIAANRIKLRPLP